MTAANNEANQFGHTSELTLTITPRSVAHQYFTAPFKVMSPFKAQNFLQIMVVKVSTGLMAGDSEIITITLAPGAKAEFLSQAFEKIHQMNDGGEAKREGHITVGDDATLYYAPLPVLPFADSAFRSSFVIDLESTTSRLFYSDVLACGRAARGEEFAYRLYESRLRIKRAGELIYVDNLHFAPAEDGTDMAGLTQYEGYSHLGTYLFVNLGLEEEELREWVGEQLEGVECLYGLTCFNEDAYCLKVLSLGSEPLVDLQNRIKDKLGRT